MVGTRRKSKLAANTEDDDGDTTAQNPQSLNVPIPEDFDIEALSSLVPDLDVHFPSPDTLLSIYQLLLEQSGALDATQREVDELRAEAEKKDVELDQALQDREQSSKDTEQQLERIQDEMTQVKRERDQLLASQSELQTRITTLSTSQNSSSNEVTELKHRLEDVEREKRDLISVISRLKQDGSEREDEISTLRSSLKEARQEHQTLEGHLREIRSTETSTKFKLESLTQQLSLAQSEVARVNTELTTKSEEYGVYRRSKQAELVALQASLSDMTQNHSSSQATLRALQSSYSSQTHQLSQALTKVQDLTGQLVEQEATYSNEANSLKRLIEMLEERERQAKNIVDTLEREWDGIGEKADARETILKSQIEQEKKGRDEAEGKVARLEKVLERMERGELPIPSRVGTPSRRVSGAFDEVHDGMMIISPTIAMASKVQKSGKSFTEVYTDYVRLQDDYEKKVLECSRMEEALLDVSNKIQERAPLLAQQRQEYERIQAEASHLASELSQAITDRDAQFTTAQENAQKFAQASRENDLLQQQLDDLGLQVRTLLKEVGRRNNPNLPSDEELETIAPAEDVQQLITNDLVLFRSIDGLQEQNQKLLGLARMSGQSMEELEKKIKDDMDREHAAAIREAHEVMMDLSAEVARQKENHDELIRGFVKEREALKTMLARANQSGSQTRLLTDGSGIDSAGMSSSVVQELAEIQNQFDTYRTEMNIDSGRLREEHITAQREIGQLQASLAKANAKNENQAERQRMLQEQINLQNQELNDLTKRNQQVFDQWTRVDVECNRVTEDLRVATAKLEQLRSECANLRAEKNIWESVQSRLVEENKSLTMERSHLSDLMSNVQKMHNELERSGENERRRLESQLQLLQNQSQDLRNQVTQERETIRNLSLQKDVEVRDLQNRLEKSVQELSQTRETLVIAETSKVHLEDRVGDLTKHIKGNEEKLAVYERRGGTRTTVERTNMSDEQQLESEVAELRSSLKVAEFDLTQAKARVQQFQSISDANETALREFQTTHDEYKASTDAQIARLESDRQALEEKLQAIQSELTELNTQHHDLQKQYEEERIAWANDKKTLEDTIVDLSTSEKVSENDRTVRESEVKQQEQRAKAAEERYSNELIAHAESIKTLESLKKQLTSVQATVRDFQTSAETATAKLTSSEKSWHQQKQTLDNEVKELQKRSNDLVEQNNVLHKHLESVSSQAAQIRQAAESTTSIVAHDSDENANADTKLSELRSVVAYLRKEKEIVDLQLELSKQENIRLRSQIDHLQHTLTETRRTLSEEREKAVESVASSAKHEELMERINQLNILRESNATLRADCEAHAKRAKELETKLQILGKQLEPAKEEARIANAELQARDTQIKRLEEENRRWQDRNQHLLTKYDRIDPSEMQVLKDEIERLKAERSTLEQTNKEREEEATQHKSRMEAVEKHLANYKETYSKNMNSFKAKLGELNTAKSKLTAEKKELEDKIADLEGRTRSLQAVSDSLQAEKASTESTVAPPEGTTVTEMASLRAERDQLLAEKAAWLASIPPSISTSEVPASWATEKAALTAAREQAEAQLKIANEKAETASGTAKNNKSAFDKISLRLQAITKAREDDAQKAIAAQEAAVSAAVEKVKSELQTSSLEESSTDLAKKHQEELKALEERLSAKHRDELKSAVENAVSSAQKAVTPSGSDVNVQAAVATAIVAHDKDREAKMAEEISAAVERGRMEAASKMKLKDSQVIRFQTKLKEYEAQVQTWIQAGILPKDTKISPLPNKVPPPPSPSMSTISSPSVASTSPTNPTTNTTLPRKPSLSNAVASTSSSAPAPVVPTPVTGRGRGVVRGVRGAVRGAVTGAGVVRGIQPKQPAQPTQSAGIAIQGAAKRPAPESSVDDSLAKRLKPATGGPVPLRRPPPP
ncbi:hypothetical protein BDP27DRAFT_1397327 [Rhodocollybia butyracea]|uniref:Nucleoprotein TPR/MLP1 domain-containing protein n=1 Tax=Rhodocollybia butyracea TaxID=206335 RepID=A0A9P5QAQ1_9AGAR|nr:hypothetical protein BDP27DRAFT_1397327 [Rhodocollybia butyracea]